jgi:hypothetical protein
MGDLYAGRSAWALLDQQPPRAFSGCCCAVHRRSVDVKPSALIYATDGPLTLNSRPAGYTPLHRGAMLLLLMNRMLFNTL